MNYDLDTPGGMSNAIVWTNQCLNLLRDGGVWTVPRSGTVVTVVSHASKTLLVSSARPDPSITRVLREGGWNVNMKA